MTHWLKINLFFNTSSDPPFFIYFFHKFEQTHIKRNMFILALLNHILQTEF